MLRPRIIPCLLIHQKGLVKTVKFKEPKYVGDPLNAVRIFNEKESDELLVLDIDATIKNREPGKRQRFGEAGRIRVIKNFSLKVSSLVYLKTYDKLLNQI